MISGSKIVVWGLGVSGWSALKWLFKQGANVYAIETSKNNPNFSLAKDLIGAEKVSDVVYKNDFWLDVACVVVSPGVCIWTPEYQTIRKYGINCISDVELFLQYYSGKVIGVTGTNGKSTLVSQINHIAINLGISSAAIGNIGVPCFDVDFNLDMVVIELSSYQLTHGISAKINLGIVTNIAPDHLSWHKTLNHYTYSKHKLARISRKLIINTDSGLYDENMQLINNASIIDLVAKSMLWPMDKVASILKTFTALPHRLQVIEHAGKKWINDSKATNAHATLYACHKFTKLNGVILILAGQSKGWVGECLPQFLHHVIIVGNPGCWNLSLGQLQSSSVNCLQEAVNLAESLSLMGDTILFSPGGASFDHYKNFADRGEAFTRYVKCLG